MALFQKGSRFSGVDKHLLDDDDIESFWSASDKRTRPLERHEILAYLERKNSVRMWQLRRNFKWMQKQMKKMGLNPEDARELL